MLAIHIGDGNIVAAGLVATKDIPCYAIVGDVPVPVICYKFEKEEIDYLLSLRW